MNSIVFFGTSEFALPALKELKTAGYDIAVVITQPDRPAGRGLRPLPSSVKKLAQELGLQVLQPGRLEIGNRKLEIPQATLGIAASYGQIIPKEIIDIFPRGILNIHPSLLPKYRGPSPIQAAILNGDEETGVTIIKMDEQMDHGDVVASVKCSARGGSLSVPALPAGRRQAGAWGGKIQSSKLGYKALHDELAVLGADLLIQILPDYLAGKIKPRPQDHSKAAYTKLIKKQDARINWQDSADKIERMIRAYEVWPVAWTTLSSSPPSPDEVGVPQKSRGGFKGVPEGRDKGRGQKFQRLKIFEAVALPSPGDGEGGLRPGEVAIRDSNLLVGCGFGVLQITELQLESAKKSNVRDFLRGHRGLEGKLLR